jgi:hypothetical protein
MTDAELNDTLIAQLSREVQKARIENAELAAAIAELTAEMDSLLAERECAKRVTEAIEITLPQPAPEVNK